MAPAWAKECPVEKAVYLADQRSRGAPSDELRISFEPSDNATPWDGFPTAVRLISHEMKRELVFTTYYTNSSGAQGISANLPEDHLADCLRQDRAEQRKAEQLQDAERQPGGTAQEPVIISSAALFITKAFDVGQFPKQGDPAPKSVIFPEFRWLGHATYNGMASVGLVSGVFRYHRCQR